MIWFPLRSSAGVNDRYIVADLSLNRDQEPYQGLVAGILLLVRTVLLLALRFVKDLSDRAVVVIDEISGGYVG